MNRQQVLKHIVGSDMPRTLIVENQTVYDIIKLIKYKHQKTATDYDAIASIFWKGNVYDTAEALWNFCKDNIHYSEESDKVQTIAQPRVILERGKGDCKHYSLFVGGVLDALTRQGYNIDWVYRFASYNILDDTPGHVFVVIKDHENDSEIWIDPVLSSFDYHKPFSSAIDKKVTVKKTVMSGIILPKSSSRLGLSGITGFGVLQDHSEAIGTTSQTGAAIMKLAPALSAVPVAAIIAEGVGLALNVFGNKYTSTTGVRWLTQKYEYYVLGIASATSDNHVNEADNPNAQKWFSYVLGVPVLDQYRYHALRGTSPVTGKSLNLTRDQRAQNYLNSLGAEEKPTVTYAQALAATYPADQFGENNIDGNWPPGSWKNFPPASALVSAQNASGSGTMQAGLFGNLPSWLIPVVLLGVLLLFVKPVKHKRKK